MVFKSEKIVTGIETRKSKKTGNDYTVINYLNENGSTFSSMVSDDCPLPADLKQLSKVQVEFEVSFYNGNVTGLKTIDIKKLS